MVDWTVTGTLLCERCYDEVSCLQQAKEQRRNAEVDQSIHQQNQEESASKLYEKIDGLQNAVEGITSHVQENLHALQNSLDGIATRLDLLIDTFQQAKVEPPPPEFYADLRTLVESGLPIDHFGITVPSPLQIPEVCRNLKTAFPKSRFAIAPLTPSDLAGILTNSESGDIIIFSQPEIWGSASTQYLHEGCSTFTMSVIIEPGPPPKTVTMNLPKFRAIIVSLRKEFLPSGVEVYWPPGSGGVSVIHSQD